jgi:hypothetical protein
MCTLAVLILSLCLASAANPAVAGKGHTPSGPNSRSISQHGTGNYATVSQSGSGNSASISQATY